MGRPRIYSSAKERKAAARARERVRMDLSACEICQKPIRLGRKAHQACVSARARGRVKECRWCGQPFTATARCGHLKTAQCCSAACGRALAGQMARDRIDRSKCTFICEGCVQPFYRPGRNTARRFCSRECFWNWRVGKHVHDLKVEHNENIGYKRRLNRMNANGREPVDKWKVFQRDGWRCQLCGCSTPRSKAGTRDPRAPQLDHIVPLARGGAHTYANTHCACQRCNQRKRQQIKGQLRLI